MKLFYLAICLASLAACQGSGSNDANSDSTAIKAIDSAGFVKDISTLASDEFQGRKPFTIGEEKTISYLEQRFKEIGLQPGNGNSYFQEVPMVELISKPDGPLVFKGKNGSLSLPYLDEYVIATRRVQEKVSISNSPLVFAGFGIVAPEYNWNDYEGLDVKGKTVVVMVNDPGFYDKSLFKGKTMTYYGRWTYKFEEAARQGATGIIIIHDQLPASYGWTVVRSGWSKPRLDLQTADDNMSRAAMEGWISQASAKALFKLAGVSDTVMQAAKHPGFKAVPLDVTTSLVITNKIRKSTSHNVLAKWPGTSLKNQYIIYTAHWDHLGVGEAIKGDSIYNGAADNASGTAALLQLATAFTKLKEHPKLCNFLPFDEGYKGKGMTRNSKLDKEIFYEYASIEKRTDLKVIAANIKASIDIKIVTATSLLQEDDPIAYEGSISYRWHKVIERNPAIVEKKKRSILNAHGKLACEICDFDFERVYGELGKGFIECHHKIPLSQIDHETPTLLSDLSLVCANCHRIIHRNIETHSFEQIKKQIRDRILNS